ncbi:MAG: DNA/RNA non-specific endonuclease [Paludibacteraceae bacterium]|nr:DNA/RNA non-specific endonuclease [Paludibacteraceae bacterium]
MNKTTFFFLLSTCTLVSSCSAPSSEAPQESDEKESFFSWIPNLFRGEEKSDEKAPKAKDNKKEKEQEALLDAQFTHSNHTGVTYKHKHYTLSYSEEDEQAEWVGYELTRQESYGEEERNELFTEDPAITTGSAHPYEYRNSGYDKGHLAPAADMRFDEEAMNESFYMSNVSPQIKEMNCGIWNDLEKQTRKWARHYGRIYVVCGPILNNPKSQKKKLSYEDKYKGWTSSNITVPDYFYKIIFDFSKKGKEKMIAFCIPNEDAKGSFYNYAVTVDSIETLTGIDFFSNLSLETQEKYESSINVKKWK